MLQFYLSLTHPLKLKFFNIKPRNFSFNWFVDSVANWVTEIFNLDCEGGSYVWLCNGIVSIAGFLEFFIRWFLYIAFIGLYLIVYKSILLIIYSPVLAYLVEIVEKKQKGIDEPFKMQQFIKDTVRGIVLAIRGLFVEGLAVLALFIMAFIPILNIIQPVLLWLVSAYFFVSENYIGGENRERNLRR